jgi:DNA-3-methyladenine glycosylase
MKLNKSFYKQNTIKLASKLVGKDLVVRKNKQIFKAMITETEAYRGFDDQACHGSSGKTKRNSPMFEAGGITYIYLIYGIYQMLNIVTERKGFPSAVLISGLDCEGCDGPGKLTRKLGINKQDHNRLDLTGDTIWLEDKGRKPKLRRAKRIGVDYAGKWADKPWRFYTN